MSSEIERPLLSEVLPAFARELVGLLQLANEAHLALQVPTLRLMERCRCGDPYCCLFYTATGPEAESEKGHRTVVLESLHGMVVLDLVDEKIVTIETTRRDQVHRLLLAALP